jgi:glycosyltransferase involved in cell wall biosynthesis
LKILHITEKPRFSGAEILIRDLSLIHIDQADIAITSINPTEDDFKEIINSLEIKGVQLFIPSHSLSKFQRFTYLFKIFKNYQPDVVVGHSAIVSAYMRIVGIFFPKIKKVVVLHAAAADYEGGDRLQKAEYLLQYVTNYVVGVSDWSANTYKKRFKHVACKAIYNGVDLEKFKIQNSFSRDIIRNKIFKTNDTNFIILQVGRINKVKNQLLTLQAISMLDNDIKDNVYTVFAGIVEDKKYFQEIIEFCENNNLTKNVQFLGARSDVNNLLYASDLYVMPSERENFSIAIVEALSTGIPIICSNISQFNFLDKYNFKNTFKFNLKDIQDYSKSISNIIEKKLTFVERNLDDFSFNKCSQQYIELFKDIKS